MINLNIPFGIDDNNVEHTLDLRNTSHIYIGGTTGSGKSILLHNITTSLIKQNTKNEIKFVLIDPKQIEFHLYKNSPYLLHPIIYNSFECVNALANLARRMEDRYTHFMELGVTNLDEYNAKAETPYPYIIAVIDEYLDIATKETNNTLIKLIQKSRAAGIYLIVATQRLSSKSISPSKLASFPTRIAMSMLNRDDSIALVGIPGAELLSGRGEMLLQMHDTTPIKLQSPFISIQEVRDIIQSHM